MQTQGKQNQNTLGKAVVHALLVVGSLGLLLVALFGVPPVHSPLFCLGPLFIIGLGMLDLARALRKL